MTAERSPAAPAVERPTPVGAKGSAWLLRITPLRWDAIEPAGLAKAVSTVIGAWLLLAWSRFGMQGITAPRAGVRFVLVGVYAWLAMAVVLYTAGVVRGRAGPRNHPASLASSGPGLTRVLQLIGLAHQPLVVGGFILQFAILLPIPYFPTALAGFTILFWLPAMVGAAVASMFRLDPVRAALLTAAVYLPWLATAGWFLFNRVGHLI